ncbi:MAG: FecR domain-containing protein [Alphaproteobacteria bacterium]|nr:FecR domain-containing protein [Alphaproteobacteria bacterium]
MPRSLRPLLLLLLCAVLALGGAPARAAATATVQVLSHVDASRRWRSTRETDQGSLFRADGSEDLLREGDTLVPGDRVVTRQARVQLVLSDGSTLHVAEFSELVLAEGGATADADTWSRLEQRAGQVYYRMKNALTVEYGTVEAVIEGTRFFVRGEAAPGAGAGGSADEVVVEVVEGAVRVRRVGETGTLVSRGQAITAALDDGQPLVETARRWKPGRETFEQTWPVGRPRLVLGVLATGTVLTPIGTQTTAEWGGGGTLFAGLHLPADLRLVVESGVTGTDLGGLRLKEGLGLSWEPGALSVGGLGTVTWEDTATPCDGVYQALHIAGEAYLRGHVPLGRRLQLLPELRAGYAETITVTPAVGLGVGL